MPIKLGLFGFGRTGSMVAKEIVKAPDIYPLKQMFYEKFLSKIQELKF